MEEDILEPLKKWCDKWGHSLPTIALRALDGAMQQVATLADDECAYARTQVENDYDGWVSPDQLEEYYVSLPLDTGGHPIHDVRIVLNDA